MDRLDWGINGLQNCKAQGSMAKVIYPSGYEQEQVPSLSWQAQASASVGQATPANARPLLRNSACPGDPAGPASGVRTVWSLVWAAPCLDHSEPQFLSSLLWNGESLGRNRVVSSTQCSGLGKDTRCGGCPTGRKPAKEIGRSRSWEWQATPGPY